VTDISDACYLNWVSNSAPSLQTLLTSHMPLFLPPTGRVRALKQFSVICRVADDNDDMGSGLVTGRSLHDGCAWCPS